MPKAKKAGSVLKKVEDLIARTASSSKEEARTSAFLACKLIREHGLVVLVPEGTVPLEGGGNRKPPQSGPVKAGAWWDTVLDDLWESAGEAVRVDPFAPSNSDIHVGQARYDGRCKGCGKPIPRGTQVAYIRTGKHRGAYHVKPCSVKASKAT
jgi:hypothetical protein